MERANQMPTSTVLTERQDQNFIITLNRPEKRNALDRDLVEGIIEAVESVAVDQEVRTIIIRGEGKGFSAGVDFMALAGTGIMQGTGAFARKIIRQLQDMVNVVADVEKPVICALHGFCYGMGTELALAADFRVAAQGTKLAIQEVELGLIPDVGGTTRLTRMVGPIKAKELIMTARVVEAEEARQIQLVNSVCEDAMAGALDLAAQLNKNAPLALAMVKKLINRGQHLDDRTFMELEAMFQSTLLWTKDVQEGVMAKMQKREPKFKGK